MKCSKCGKEVKMFYCGDVCRGCFEKVYPNLDGFTNPKQDMGNYTEKVCLKCGKSTDASYWRGICKECYELMCSDNPEHEAYWPPNGSSMPMNEPAPPVIRNFIKVWKWSDVVGQQIRVAHNKEDQLLIYYVIKNGSVYIIDIERS